MRTLRWGFILLQALWLNVVVPGHTRGAFAMPGSKPVTSKADGCCSAKHGKQDKQDQSPCSDDKARCAVCHYAIGLTLPPVFTVDHRPSGLVGILPAPRAENAVVAEIRLACSERGPPVM